MFCSLAAYGRRGGRRFQYGRLFRGSVDGRRDKILRNGRRSWCRRRHGRRFHAVSSRPETEATSPLHPGPGLRVGEAVQATKIPQRTRKGTPSFSHTPYTHPGKFHFFYLLILPNTIISLFEPFTTIVQIGVKKK